jgi:hypothetical protein
MPHPGDDDPTTLVLALFLHAAAVGERNLDEARRWAADGALDQACHILESEPQSIEMVAAARSLGARKIAAAMKAATESLGPLTSDASSRPSVRGQAIVGRVGIGATADPLAMFYVSSDGMVYQSPVSLHFAGPGRPWLRGKMRIVAPVNFPREDVERKGLTFQVIPNDLDLSVRLPGATLLSGSLDVELDYPVAKPSAQAILKRGESVIATFRFQIECNRLE